MCALCSKGGRVRATRVGLAQQTRWVKSACLGDGVVALIIGLSLRRLSRKFPTLKKGEKDLFTFSSSFSISRRLARRCYSVQREVAPKLPPTSIRSTCST